MSGHLVLTGSGLALLGAALIASAGGYVEAERQACAALGSTTPGPDARVGEPLHLRTGQAVSIAATVFDGTTGAISGHPGEEDLRTHPDTYAELSTLADNPSPRFSFTDADALGNLPYLTPLRVTHDGRSLVLYKRDIGFGQGTHTLDGHPARIDIYRPAAKRLGISYSMVRVSIARPAGAGNTLHATRESRTAQQAESAPSSRILPSAQAARRFAASRRGHTAFAVARPDGTIASALHADERVQPLPLMNAILIVAAARRAGNGAIDEPTIALSNTAIRRADARVTRRLLRDVGTSAADSVTRATLRTSPGERIAFATSNRGPTVADVARFIARYERLVPRRHRDWVDSVLAGTSADTGSVFRSAVRVADGTWTVQAGGALTASDSLAVVSVGSRTARYGQATIEGVARELSDTTTNETCASTAGFSGPLPLTAGSRATVLDNGAAAAPRDAPEAVKRIIAAANEIIARPYVYGGGHGLSLAEIAPSYDCSSSVSHALFGARLVGPEPLTSGELEGLGQAGPGRWVTVEANADHTYMYVAGLRFDTSPSYGGGNVPAGTGPRWRTTDRPDVGFVARHPEGL